MTTGSSLAHDDAEWLLPCDRCRLVMSRARLKMSSQFGQRVKPTLGHDGDQDGMLPCGCLAAAVGTQVVRQALDERPQRRVPRRQVGGDDRRAAHRAGAPPCMQRVQTIFYSIDKKIVEL